LLAPVALAAPPAHAEIRARIFRFIAPNEAVEGYRFYLFDEVIGVDRVVDAGALLPAPNGVAEASLTLDTSRSYRVQMTAYNEFGESARSNAVRVSAAPEPAPEPEPASGMRVDQVSPHSVTPGKHRLTITGQGFTGRPKVYWENGEGKRPKTRVLRLHGTERLEVKVKVKRKHLKGPTRWDLRLVMDDGQEARLPGALQVDPRR
jgi:hypothetical protein